MVLNLFFLFDDISTIVNDARITDVLKANEKKNRGIRHPYPSFLLLFTHAPIRELRHWLVQPYATGNGGLKLTPRALCFKSRCAYAGFPNEARYNVVHGDVFTTFTCDRTMHSHDFRTIEITNDCENRFSRTSPRKT